MDPPAQSPLSTMTNGESVGMDRVVSHELLRALMNPDAFIRSRAEQVYQKVPERASSLLTLLSTLICTDANASESALAAVLLRREISRGGLVEPARFLDPLLDGVSSSSSSSSSSTSSAAMALSHCVGELCRVLSTSGDEHVALEAVSHVWKRIGEACTHNEVALSTLTSVADRAPVAFWTVLKPFAEDLGRKLVQVQTQTQTCGTCASQSHKWEAVARVAMASEIVTTSLSLAENELSVAVTSQMQMLGGRGPDRKVDTNSFAYRLGVAVRGSLGTGSSTSSNRTNDDNNEYAWLVECVVRAPSLVAGLLSVAFPSIQGPTMAEAVVSMLESPALSLLASEQQSQQQSQHPWSSSLSEVTTQALVPWCLDTLRSDDEDESDHAEELLSRAVEAMPVLELPLLQHVEPWLSSTNNDKQTLKRTAMTVLQLCPNQCPTATALEVALSCTCNDESLLLSKSLHLMVGALCNVDDTDSLVRSSSSVWERCVAHLVRCMSVPDVCSNACRAVSSLCQHVPELLTDNEHEHDKITLCRLVQGLLTIQFGEEEERDADAVGAMAMLAVAVGGEALATSGSYHQLMPLLLTMADSDSNKVVRVGAALEAASIVGRTVSDYDANLFRNADEQLLALALPLVTEQPNLQAQALATCARIAAVWKDRFVSVLPPLIPVLLKQAAQPADWFSDSDSDDYVVVDLPHRGPTRLTIHTNALQEKSDACRALYELAEALGPNFGTYAESCASVLLTLVDFRYSSEVRSTAAMALAAVHRTLPPTQNSFSASFVSLLLQRLSTVDNDVDVDQEDYESVAAYAEALYNVLSDTTGHVTPDEAMAMIAILVHVFSTCRTLFQNNPHWDEPMTPLTDAIGCILKTKCPRPQFLHVFDRTVAPFFGPLLSSSGPSQLAAICLYDDCVEFTQGHHAEDLLLHGIVPVISNHNVNHNNNINNVDDSTMELYQAVVYGLVQVGRYAPHVVPPSQQLPLVTQLVHYAQTTNNDILREHAVSALAAWVLFPSTSSLPPQLDLQPIVNIFLNSLPLTEDDSEAKICHEGFCRLVEHRPDLVDVRDPTTAVRVLTIVADCLPPIKEEETQQPHAHEGPENVSPDTLAAFVRIVRSLAKDLSSPHLTRESQQALSRLL